MRALLKQASPALLALCMRSLVMHPDLLSPTVHTICRRKLFFLKALGPLTVCVISIALMVSSL